MQVEALTERLPASKALLQALLDKLERKEMGEEERLATLAQVRARTALQHTQGSLGTRAAAGGAGAEGRSGVRHDDWCLCSSQYIPSHPLHHPPPPLPSQLGELSDWDAAPALAAALHDGEAVAAAAEEALWWVGWPRARV